MVKVYYSIDKNEMDLNHIYPKSPTILINLQCSHNIEIQSKVINLIELRTFLVMKSL